MLYCEKYFNNTAVISWNNDYSYSMLMKVHFPTGRANRLSFSIKTATLKSQYSEI